MQKKKKTVVEKQMYKMYKEHTLPPSSEKGVPFVDFNEVIKNMRKKGYIKRVKKRRTNGRL